MKRLLGICLALSIILLATQYLTNQTPAKASGDYRHFLPNILKSSVPSSLKLLHSDVVYQNGLQVVIGQIKNDMDESVRRITVRVDFYHPDGRKNTSVSWGSPAGLQIPPGGTIDFSVKVPDEVDWPTNTVKVDSYD